jgi:hypothetical protein
VTDEIGSPPGTGKGESGISLRALGIRATESVEQRAEKANPPPAPKDKLEEDQRRVTVDRARSDLRLSKVVGYGVLTLMAVQLVIADKAFFDYGHAYGWKIPVASIETWLAAIAIQVIGVVLEITKYLFPGEQASKGG